jgi:hypothetical protein
VAAFHCSCGLADARRGVEDAMRFLVAAMGSV